MDINKEFLEELKKIIEEGFTKIAKEINRLNITLDNIRLDKMTKF